MVSPISVAAPTSLDQRQSADLENVRLATCPAMHLSVPQSILTCLYAQYLQAANLYDTPDQIALRQEVMGRLSTLSKHWVRTVTQELGLGEHMLAEANAEIFTFGSYRLGVHGPGMPSCSLACVVCIMIAAMHSTDDHTCLQRALSAMQHAL